MPTPHAWFCAVGLVWLWPAGGGSRLGVSGRRAGWIGRAADVAALYVGKRREAGVSWDLRLGGWTQLGVPAR